jgi:mannose-6-phosphate isomerase-like protein (cupin superfamily)
MHNPTVPTLAAHVLLKPGEGEILDVVTDRVQVVADSAATQGRCSIFVITSPPGSGPPLHRHGIDDEHFYILEGRFTFVCDGKTVHAEPGCSVTARRGSVHTFVNAGTTPGRMLVVTTPGGLEVPFRETHQAAKQGPLTPDVLAPIFSKFKIEFLGPPLNAADAR